MSRKKKSLLEDWSMQLAQTENYLMGKLNHDFNTQIRLTG